MLQALYQMAQDEGLLDDPDYEPKPVAYLVRVGDGGKLLGIEGTHTTPPAEGKKKPKPVAKSFRIPRQPTGRAGTKAPPAFLVDNAKYVFGLPTADKDFPPEEGKEKSSWFQDLVAKCAEATNDEGALAVLKLLERVAAGKQKVELSEDCKSNELFAFVYAPDIDILVHDRPKVRDYWKRQREQPAGGAGAADLQCLVTGETMRDVCLFPLIKRVPGGATAGVGLVSFNKSAFWSHGWENNENAPISRAAAEGCATALNRLLNPAYPDPKNPHLTLRPHHIRLSDDTVVCYWARGTAGGELVDWMSELLNASDPDKIADVYRSLWTGRFNKLDDPSAFYAVTLSGAQGRAVVRDWFETTVGAVTDNLARHFGDLAIVRNTPTPKQRQLPPVLPLAVLLRSLAPMGDEKGIPDPLAAQFVRAALQGRPYPYSILQKALERARAEIGRTDWGDLERRDARAALIKAVLLRRTEIKIGVNMNPQATSEGYNLGCLMAVLERLQEAALDNVNASVIDRYFAAASATPRSVFVRLLRNAQHHARKARDNEKNAGLSFLLKNLVDEFVDRFQIDSKNLGYPGGAGIPAFLPLEQQGLFVVGYHQMRKWLWMTKDERSTWMKEYPASPRAFQWGNKDASQLIKA